MAPRKKANTQRVTTFLSSAILDKLETEAEKKATTVSGLIRMIIVEYFAEK